MKNTKKNSVVFYEENINLKEKSNNSFTIFDVFFSNPFTPSIYAYVIWQTKTKF